MLVLSEHEYRIWIDNFDRMMSSIRESLKKQPEIYCSKKNPEKSIYIEPFRNDDPKSSFSRLFSYVYKAYVHGHWKYPKISIPRIFPYENRIGNQEYQKELSNRKLYIERELKKYDDEIDKFLRNTSLDLSKTDQ